jgi:DNA relaxase NicK
MVMMEEKKQGIAIRPLNIFFNVEGYLRYTYRYCRQIVLKVICPDYRKQPKHLNSCASISPFIPPTLNK